MRPATAEDARVLVAATEAQVRARLAERDRLAVEISQHRATLALLLNRIRIAEAQLIRGGSR